MSNAYAKEKSTLRYYNEIDELSYLELNKVFFLSIPLELNSSSFQKVCSGW